MENEASVTNHCEECRIEITGKAKFCSPRCRQIAHRRASVTENVTVTSKIPTVTFQFTVGYNRKPGDEGYDEDTARSRQKVRQATYWYDIPLAAIPVYEKGWPKLPESMNGRQYFLWWKNEFKTKKDGTPIILNPYPKHDNLRYEMGGEGSRRWGA